MKTVIVVLSILLSAVSANARLDLLGQGTSVHGTYNLIYDTDRDITWYDFTYSVGPFSVTWQSALNWASTLSVNFGGIYYDDWRLPVAVDSTYIYGYDGTTSGGYNITSSEMGHLYYAELGNVGYYDTSGNLTGCTNCLTNTGYFQNLQMGNHWTGTGYSAALNYSWDFNLRNGFQGPYDKQSGAYALAVMDGMAVVPEPVSSILFITGGATLGFRRFRKKFKK